MREASKLPTEPHTLPASVCHFLITRASPSSPPHPPGMCVTFLQGKELFLFSWCYAIEHEWQLIFGHAGEAKIHPSTGAECKQIVFRERAKKKLRNVENAEQGLAALKECESEPGCPEAWEKRNE